LIGGFHSRLLLESHYTSFFPSQITQVNSKAAWNEYEGPNTNSKRDRYLTIKGQNKSMSVKRAKRDANYKLWKIIPRYMFSVIYGMHAIKENINLALLISFVIIYFNIFDWHEWKRRATYCFWCQKKKKKPFASYFELLTTSKSMSGPLDLPNANKLSAPPWKNKLQNIFLHSFLFFRSYITKQWAYSKSQLHSIMRDQGNKHCLWSSSTRESRSSLNTT
jgi:hypothetical protein